MKHSFPAPKNRSQLQGKGQRWVVDRSRASGGEKPRESAPEQRQVGGGVGRGERGGYLRQVSLFLRVEPGTLTLP